MNLKEARALTNLNNIDEIYDLFIENGVKNLIIKCDKDGAYFNHKYYPAISFVSGFIHSIANNSSIEQAIEFGNKLGNYACRHIGSNSWVDIEL